ncbi:Iron-sulfur cluster-binding protein [hydrothermal vent metagenome]|uniref:Iron-sulfur cluster-binding protein n=1 Tax=hydrothermal vent metagenome TaxID=652676 RepID=A0A1W1BRA2_9ZZZZ
MSLSFDLASCTRAVSRLSECRKCVDICPVETINIVDNIPSFTPSACVDCGGCVGVCPTEAFSLDEFSTVEFFFSILEDSEPLISCKKNLPCISILSVEHLISIALSSDEPITLDLGHCHNCEIKEPLYEQILANIEEANFILSSFSDKQLLSEDLAYSPMEVEKKDDTASSRRSFLSNISIKGVAKHKEAFDKAVNADDEKRFEIDENTISKIKEHRLPDKRKILFTTLKRATKPKQYEVLPEEEVSFTSQKYVDESCTNCQICYRICPTGALSSDGKFSLINFDAMLCLKCRLCHDVCEPDAIKLQGGFEIKEFFEPTQRTLAKFNIKRCNECGGYFTYQGGEMICPRCAVEEDEARTLHQNARDMNF